MFVQVYLSCHGALSAMFLNASVFGGICLFIFVWRYLSKEASALLFLFIPDFLCNLVASSSKLDRKRLAWNRQHPEREDSYTILCGRVRTTLLSQRQRTVVGDRDHSTHLERVDSSSEWWGGGRIPLPAQSYVFMDSWSWMNVGSRDFWLRIESEILVLWVQSILKTGILFTYFFT